MCICWLLLGLCLLDGQMPEMVVKHLIIAIYVGIGLHLACRIGVKGVISDEKWHVGVYFQASHQPRIVYACALRFALFGLRKVGLHGIVNLIYQRWILLIEQEHGQFKWFLHPDATVRNATIAAVESPFRGCVVYEDGEIVVEPEHDAAQGVALATLLYHKIVGTEQHTSRHIGGVEPLSC